MKHAHPTLPKLHPTLCCGVLPYNDYEGIWRCSVCDRAYGQPASGSERGLMVTIRQAREMAELYRAGWSQDWIAEQFGVAQSTIHYHLRKQGVRRRPRLGNPGRLSHEEMDRTVRLYKAGLTTYEIGQALERSHSSIAERLRRAGVPLRSKSEAAAEAWRRKRISA